MKTAFVAARDFLAGSPWRRRVLYSVLGAVVGYTYYYFIGCRTGSCPITGNPWISTAYGGGVGLLMALGERRTKRVDQ